MEVFTGDRCMPTDVVLYPNNLTHFPSTPSDNHSPGIFTQPPPQKLRPIRCNGRNSADFSDPTSGCYEPPVEELGFFTQPSTEKQSESKEGGESSGSGEYLGSCALPENLGVNLENTFSSVGVECKKLLAQAQKFEAELSSSSEHGKETLKAIEKPSKRKRKRTRAKLESFVESMILSVMQKQDQLHRQLIEILEKKEEERLAREEAWKQQQIERANREREERAQETSRSLALISFIQKFMGHEIQIPVPLKIMSQEKEGYEIPNQEDCGPSKNQEILEELKCGSSNNQEKLEDLKCVLSNKQEDFDRDRNNRRWPKSEVQALITVRTELSLKFNPKGPKNFIWEEVSVRMCKLGYFRTAKKCREKWDNINKYYKRVTGNGSTKRSDKSKVCQYFNELDMLYKSGFIGSGNLDSAKEIIEEQSVLGEEKEMLTTS